MYFFKDMSGFYMHSVCLPEELTTHLADLIGKQLNLRLPSGDTWQVGLISSGSKLAFQSGWFDFVRDNCVSQGDLLFFKFQGRSEFKVRIFDSWGCEKSFKVNVELDEPSYDDDVDANSKTSDSNEKVNEKSNEEFEEKGSNGLEEETGGNSQISYEYPESEFYNFEKDRTFEKIEPGQIWALYSFEDVFPKYYVSVKRVKPLEEIVYIKWLIPVSKGLVGEEKRWVDSDLPIGCGLFKISGKVSTLKSNYSFSHVVDNVGMIGKRNRYKILPAKDEIWALYRNWTVGWDLDDIKEKCQYDLVLINKCKGAKGIKVSVLSKVEGYKAVFTMDRLRKQMVIPKEEYIRFSHKIPSCQLRDEKDGMLRGCFELDPASLPENLFG